jgi:hypothetical protein
MFTDCSLFATSQSKATAAVQDCSMEPSGAPENVSKYSAKPPWAIWSRLARRIRAAR